MQDGELFLYEMKKQRQNQGLKQGQECGVCSKVAKYVCPKCRQASCSLEHYQQHSDECRESFYRQQVEQWLKGRKVNDHDRRKMQDIIRRQQTKQQDMDIDDDNEDEDYNDDRLQEMLRLVEQGEVNKVWNMMDDKQKMGFERFIDSKEISEYVEEWSSFWDFKSYLPNPDIMEDSSIEEILEKHGKIDKKVEEMIRKRHELYHKQEQIQKLSQNQQLGKGIEQHLLMILYIGVVGYRVYNGKIEMEDWLEQMAIMDGKKEMEDGVRIVIEESKVDQIEQVYYEMGMVDMFGLLESKMMVMEMLMRLEEGLEKYIEEGVGKYKGTLQEGNIKMRLVNRIRHKIGFINRWVKEMSYYELQKIRQQLYQRYIGQKYKMG